MSFNDLFESGKHRRHVGHFAAIVTLASSNGTISEGEQKLIERFARKLNINDDEYKEIIANPSGYPINPPNSRGKRLERIYDLFKIIYADHRMDDQECKLINRYAIGLGFDEEDAGEIIKKSEKIFGGQIPYEDYLYLLEKK